MMKKQHVTAVIPAYNEGNTIESVLIPLKSSKLIDKIIVINDGSTDNTFEIVNKQNVKVINLDRNMGKSQAIKYGCSDLKTDTILFCDADLIGFKQSHVKKILEPVINGEAAMSIGLRNRGKLQNYMLTLFPLISGERAIEYSIFKEMLNSKYFYDYGMEPVMNHYCQENKLNVKSLILNYNHVSKTKKIKKGGLLLLIKEILHIWYVYLALKISSK